NEPSVTALLQKNPFAVRPPRYLRARFYDYRYADRGEKARGLWWERRSLGLYFPVVRLTGE
ncbi:MAG: lipase maturation factor family protein, partial [Steroidobacteraceae bacterium]